ncbi:ATP-binding protein [Criblamydia sequanensis]|uniref:histidine kinase n=1 Tax=Candidatus Criblamydia sequanensis CRIB-18 TaxID=1437425 RepID=A0A090CZ70_9BACT|nr:ATP-binding protein [Criblamydia sequanensis]CDR34056.1 Sensor protein KdpD [Criblamydia sequanensis CRIB-18]
MTPDERLDPDELLKAVQETEKKQKLGKLKIFFGMAAGVGKTYSMLEAAHNLMKEGVNLIVGVVNTHGRMETEKLLAGLPLLPEKWVKYKDTVFEELDLEAILKAKPDLVLIDELAHTNVPGSKHPKRWQDVLELLEAGIDVYTTLNVQHIESRKDLVENITGIKVNETVPDLLLEHADTLEIIDISPNELLQRLNEGKVYFPEQSKIAAQNFFQKDNLTALREIALRLTAEKVDHDLHGMLIKGKKWRTRERLMVAISSSPSSQQLIRAARKLAFELDAPWYAVYVDTGVKLNDQDQLRLNAHLNLASELGALTITTHDLDIVAGLNRIAKQKGVTRIIVGRPPVKRNRVINLFSQNIIERIEKENKDVDIIVLRQDKATSLFRKSHDFHREPIPFVSYLYALITIAAITFFGYALLPYVGYKSVGFVYLLGILILNFFLNRGPIFFAAILSAFAWNYLFIPPLFTLAIHDPEDIALITIYFITAFLLGFLTRRLREQDQFLHQREEKMEKLYEIEQEIAESATMEALISRVTERLELMFDGFFNILVKTDEGSIKFDSKINQDEKEKAVASLVFQTGQMAGWSTNTLPSVNSLYLPIKFSKEAVGVLVYTPNNKRTLSRDELNFLQTVNHHLGIYIERHFFEQKIHYEDYTRQIEKIHQSLFHTLNRNFYMPLEQILNILAEIKKAPEKPIEKKLLSKLDDFIQNLKFIIDNVIALSEIESGYVRLNIERLPIQKLIDEVLENVKFLTKDEAVEAKGQLNLMAPFDFKLLKLALNNLIVNAFEYSNFKGPIEIEVRSLEDSFEIKVCDHGPGIPKEVHPYIFDKFYRVSGEDKPGLGLGLSLVRSVIEMHQGRIEVKNKEEGGVEFTLILPLKKE